MKLYIRLFALFILVGLLIAGCAKPAKDEGKLKEITVDSLKVQDIPNDGGDGLMVSWKPLSKEHRILEYRIYRGVHPDSLFFISSIPVNVKTGVSSERMYYYDSGYNPLIDINSPGKLKNEKQNEGSILYREFPRDIEVAARLSESFNLLSSIEDKYFYYQAAKSRSADKEDESVYAGLKFNQQTILGALKTSPSEQDPIYYYYTVVPVNERNQYLGIPKPVKGFALDDRPEKASALYCVALEDVKKLQFEWDLPLNNGDLASYTIFMLPGADETAWKAMDDAAREATAANAIPIKQGGVGGGALRNYWSVTDAEMAAMNPGLNWETMKGSRYFIRYNDYGYPLPSPLADILTVPALKTSADLPKIAKFRVEDKAMDKGDRLSVTWGEPIVTITTSASLNAAGDKIKLTYQINKTDAQKIKNIYFSLYEKGKKQPFAEVNEFHQDNIISIKLPQNLALKNKAVKDLIDNEIEVRITLKTQKYTLDKKSGQLRYASPKLLKDYEIKQYLKPDLTSLVYMPTPELYNNGVEISNIKNVVYRKSYRGNEFSLVKKNTAYDNNLDVSIPYSTSVTKQILGINFVKGDTLHTWMDGKRFARKLEAGEKARSVTLVSSEIDLIFDPVEKKVLNTSIFRDEAGKKVDELKKDLKEEKANLATTQNRLSSVPADSVAILQAQIAQAQGKLESLEKQIKMYEQNPEFKRSLKYKTNDGMMRYVASIREPEGRKHNYMVVRTDGMGMYVESEPDQNEKDEYNYYAPISNWFDWNKLITLFAVIIFGAAVVVFVNLAKRGKDLYLRPIAGLQDIDNAVGRATEMGRPMLYCMGNGGLSDVATLASMGILSQVAKKAAEYDTKLIVPCYDYIVMPIAQEIVREAHYAVGRPDSYDKNNIFYLTSVQFAYVAGVNGIMIRERMATNFFMGYFAAEALLMTETGNAVGAVQIAGSDAITQIPFFITTCDYTLIGEELYAASAYLTREPMLLGTLKAQDYFKFLILILVIIGALLASFQVTGFMQIFPLK